MREIYTTAISATIWLGDEAIDSAISIRLIREVSTMAKGTVSSLYTRVNHVLDIERRGLPDFKSPEWKAINDLLSLSVIHPIAATGASEPKIRFSTNGRREIDEITHSIMPTAITPDPSHNSGSVPSARVY